MSCDIPDPNLPYCLVLENLKDMRFLSILTQTGNRLNNMAPIHKACEMCIANFVLLAELQTAELHAQDSLCAN